MDDTCRPCRAFSEKQKSLQDRGKRFDTLSNVALGLGILTAGAAGAAWYWEIKHAKKDETGVAAAPVIGKDYLGAAATLRF